MLKFCSLYSGSSGNALYVSDGNTAILIDAGVSGKKILAALKTNDIDPGSISAICVTHEHSDHIKGLGILSRGLNIPIYANEKTWTAVKDKIGEVSPENQHIFQSGETFMIRDIGVQSFSTPHDAVDPVGFSFLAQGKKITVATDIGHVTDALVQQIVGSDFVLLEANHDVEMLRMGNYPWHLKQRILGDQGHLSNESVANLLVRLIERGVSQFALGHLSKENNFPELVFQTVKNILLEKKMQLGEDAFVEVMARDCVGSIVTV